MRRVLVGGRWVASTVMSCQSDAPSNPIFLVARRLLVFRRGFAPFHRFVIRQSPQK